MLSCDWKASNKKKGTTKTTVCPISWHNCTIRLSEELQIIDLNDCFNAVYTTSPSSASVAMHKHFTTERDETFRMIGGDIYSKFYTAKWENTHQGRTCLKVSDAKDFFEKRVSHMEHTKKLVSLLDKDRVTGESMLEAFNASEESIIQENACTAVALAKSSITREEALSQANSVLVLKGYNTKVMAETAEDELRKKRAKTQMSEEDIRLAEAQYGATVRSQSVMMDSLMHRKKLAKEAGIDPTRIDAALEKMLFDGIE